MPVFSLRQDGADPAAVLLLLTGLPAAGKSHFVEAALHHSTMQPQQSFPLFGGRRSGRIAAALQLDTILHSLPSPSANSRASPSPSAEEHVPPSAVFSPERWKQAGRELHRQTQVVLRTCLREARAHDRTKDGEAVVPFVLVEDNMHLRSMRERFHRLCRRAEAQEREELHPADEDDGSGNAVGFIAVLELRFTVPVAVCVERNAQRSPELQVPAAVILSMDALFERCVDTTTSAMDVASATWWRWTPTTQPWSLLELAPAAAELSDAAEGRSSDGLPTAADLAREFFAQTLQEPAWRAFQAQCTQIMRSRTRRQQLETAQKLAAHQRSAAQVQSHTHDLDLQLRAVVHLLLKDQHLLWPASFTRSRCRDAVGPRMSTLKKQALQQFKRESGALLLEDTASDEDDSYADALAELHEACLVRFQQSLAALFTSELK